MGSVCSLFSQLKQGRRRKWVSSVCSVNQKKEEREKLGEGGFYWVVELEESWEKRWDELKDCIANAVESGRRKLIVVVHVVAVAL